MPRPTGSFTTPSYRRHRASGQAVVTIGGRDFYLGLWRSKASSAEYDRLVGEWLAAGRRAPVPANDLTVTELIARYWSFAEPYYTNANGHTGQLDGVRSALKIVRQLYGHTLAAEFGPLALRTVQAAMVKADWARSHVNAQVGRIRRMIKWGVAHELLPSSALHALQAVEGLRYGKCDARETEPIKPVPAPFVDAVLPFLSPRVRVMVELQSLTGMRSGEVVQMRTADIDTTAQLWVYRPQAHKTRHRGHDRMIYLGERAKELLRPFLKTDLAAFIFSPAEAEAARRTASMKDPAKPNAKRRKKPQRKPGDRYDTHSYRRAVQTACAKAFPMPADIGDGLSEVMAAEKRRAWRREHRFHPHQLRHAMGTEVRRQFGIEGTQAALGQRTVSAAQVYGEKSDALAQKIAASIG